MTQDKTHADMKLSYVIENAMTNIDADTWQSCALNAPPFLSHAFFAALEDSESVGSESGWVLRAMLIRDQDTIIAIVPMYEKHHSYGEYVFDHAWANAYQQHQLDYYPKLLIAVPFTPVTANKILCKAEYDNAKLTEFILDSLKHYCQSAHYSSIHWLYVTDKQKIIAKTQQFCERTSVQFQWQNQNYASFDDFLDRFTSRKRKDIRKERRKVQQLGVEIKSLAGNQISVDDIAFFYQCYRQTYLKRSGHAGYLTREFFEKIYANLRDNLLLIIAYQNQHPIAAALYLFNHTGLYGRYWGALKDIDGLHFECCYYAGIEFAIANQLPIFNPGTQGEHKLLRGFEPIYCHSLHYLVEPAFHSAVADYVVHEQQAIEHYYQQTTAAVPFKKTQSDQKLTA